MPSDSRYSHRRIAKWCNGSDNRCPLFHNRNREKHLRHVSRCGYTSALVSAQQSGTKIQCFRWQPTSRREALSPDRRSPRRIDRRETIVRSLDLLCHWNAREKLRPRGCWMAWIFATAGVACRANVRVTQMAKTLKGSRHGRFIGNGCAVSPSARKSPASQVTGAWSLDSPRPLP